MAGVPQCGNSRPQDFLSLPDRLDILLLVLIWNLVKLETVARRNRNRHPSVTETTARNQAGETLEVVRTGPSFGSPTL